MQRLAAYQIFLVFACATSSLAEDPELARLQGVWIRQIRDVDGKPVTITKDVRGNREIFRAEREGEILQEHVVDFAITKTDNVRVFTYRNLKVTMGPNAGREQKQPVSYLYRVTDEQWICLHGAMTNDKKPFQVEIYGRQQAPPAEQGNSL